MNSYLVKYKYDYADGDGTFTEVVEGESYKQAALNFKKGDNPATIVDMQVLPNPQTNYTQLKNHIHNTLEITKEDVRSFIEEAVENIVERRVDILIRDKLNVQHLIDEAIKKKFDKHNWFWGESEDTLDDYVKKEVVRKLMDGVHLKVEIANKKTATKTGDSRLVVKKRKR